MATPSIAGIRGERQIVKVDSASEPGVVHWVDVERELCSCKARTRCWHIESTWCAHCLGFGTTISYPRLMTCLHCDGTGRAA